MKKIVLIATIMVLLNGCAFNLAFWKKPVKVEQSLDEVKEERIRLEYQSEVEQKRFDTSIYFGEGIAPIGNDYGEAIILAKERALKDLSECIMVIVKSDVERTMLSKEIYTKDSHSEELEDVIKSKVKIYTEQLLTDLQGRKDYTDFPTKGNITCTVWLSKESYEQKVKKDLLSKKDIIMQTIKVGNEHFREERFIPAIQSWISARELIENLFGYSGLKGDVDSDGIEEILSVYLENRMTKLFANIQIQLSEDGFSYDISGKMNKKPMLYVKYIDDDLKKYNKFMKILKNHPDYDKLHGYLHPKARLGAVWLRSKGKEFFEN